MRGKNMIKYRQVHNIYALRVRRYREVPTIPIQYTER